MNICPHQCLQMGQDAAGFFFPEVVHPESCTECGACQKVCPVLFPVRKPEAETTALAACSEHQEVRMSSSSGGVFTELAHCILERGGIVYGAVYNEAYEVVHVGITTPEELSGLRGAKYSQSRLGDCFRDIRAALQAGRWVLFVGIPCQAAGLKSFLRKEYDTLVTVDCVCHGVPAPGVWKEYLSYRNRNNGNGRMPAAVNLRSKETGWSRYRYSTVYRYPEGQVYSAGSTDDLYMKLFVGDYINRESCGDCQFKGTHRATDLTLGDFWGIWDILPEMDDDKGTSLVLVHSEKGRKLLEEASGGIRMQPVTLEQATAQNPAVLVSARPKPERAQVLKLCLDGRFEEVGRFLRKKEQKKRSFWANLPGRIWRKLRSF